VLAAGIAVVVALGAVGLSRITDHHSATAPANGSTPGRLAGISATTAKDVVIEADQGRLRVFPLDGRHEVDLPTHAPAWPDRPMSLRNGAVVWFGYGHVWVVKDPLHGRVADLGTAYSVPVAGPNPGQLWIISAQATTEPRFSVQLRCVGGGGAVCGADPSPSFPVPAGLVPVASTASGLLLEPYPLVDTGPAWVWDPLSGAFKSSLPLPAQDIIDSNGYLVAWRGGSAESCPGGREPCALHVTNLATGADRVIPPPPGYDQYIRGGAFSPDGHRLAVFAVTAPPTQNAKPVIVQLGPTSVSTELLPTSVAVGEDVGVAVWEPSGNAVFVTGGITPGSLAVCRLDTRNCVDTHLPASAELAVL
jgi:hypothetical protein